MEITNKNLVIAAVGDQSLHTYWSSEYRSNYDVFLIYYGDGEGFSSDAKNYMKRKGSKFHLIADVLDEHPDILSKYSYVWMPDDDICLTVSDVNRLFKIAEQYGLWICQPSLMGWYGLATTLHQNDCLLRYTNYVEIMCPCFDVEALKKCKLTFRENKSGWGIDALWNVILEHPTNKLAIIDDVVAVHTRPVGGGDIYKNQTGQADTSAAMKEAIDLYKKYNLADENYCDLSHGKAVSQELFHKLYFNIVEYSRVFRSSEAGVPTTKRLWPPSEIVAQLCNAIRDKDSRIAKAHQIKV